MNLLTLWVISVIITIIPFYTCAFIGASTRYKYKIVDMFFYTSSILLIVECIVGLVLAIAD